MNAFVIPNDCYSFFMPMMVKNKGLKELQIKKCYFQSFEHCV